MKIFSPLEHSDYAVIDSLCACSVCSDWRWKLSTIERALSMTEGHRRNCYCDSCKAMRKAKASYLASLNKRDFYCEMSWHAGHSVSGETIMAMVNQELASHTDNWWYVQSSRVMISDWLDKFGGIASGAISSFAMAVSGIIAA